MRQAERAVFDLRRGLPVLLRTAEVDTLIHPLECLREEALAAARALAGSPPMLVLSRHRMASLGLPITEEAAALSFDAVPDARALRELASSRLEGLPDDIAALPASPVAQVALRLLRRAQMLPAALALPVAPGQTNAVAEQLANGSLLAVDLEAAAALCASGPAPLLRVSDARVPLPAIGDTRFVLFRETDALHEHVAILIGERANWQEAVPVRLHSACLTGDIFGSMRCDCGAQLRRGMAAIQAQSGGILLYLAQEGRGIGLGNKLRAYQLQDQGLDTIDADQVIGYGKDERDFRTAHDMLDQLGVSSIELLTNNPAKVEALRRAGTRVVGRQAIYGQLTAHNRHYLSTKADRHGHWLHDLLNEQGEVIPARAADEDGNSDGGPSGER